MDTLPADTPAPPAGNAPTSQHRKLKLLSLSDLDQRTAAAKQAQAAIRAIESDLGGSDRITAGEAILVRRAGMAAVMAEDLEARWLSGREIDVGMYSTLINALSRLCRLVGLERRAKDIVPALGDYIASRNGEAESTSPSPAPLPPPPPPDRP